MSAITLSRRDYAAAVEAPEEEIEPIPSMAPALGGQALLPYQLALPTGHGTFIATFEFSGFDGEQVVDGVLVRYGLLRPVPKRLDRTWYLRDGDILQITYHP